MNMGVMYRYGVILQSLLWMEPDHPIVIMRVSIQEQEKLVHYFLHVLAPARIHIPLGIASC